MYHTINEFLADWKYESESTFKMFSSLTDESLNKKFNDNVRTAGRLAWHITTTIPEMMNRTDLKVESVEEHADVPKSAKEIADLYKKSSGDLANEISKKWSDESLKEKVNMYGDEWSKAKILSVLITHQIHHRAQLTVVMRLAGLKVPGIYGPSKEEWAAMGMEPMQ
jgi:uncharacterized damage-inducible protein DinB